MMQLKMISKLLLISLCLISTAAVQAAVKQPDWLNGSSSQYPDELYLVGRGVGSTEAEAQNRARGDLATIFEVRVQVASENTTTVVQSGKKEQVNNMATQKVSATTDEVISGINIAKIWRDPVTKDFHAFAVLSRTQAGASLREELGKIDSEVQQQVQAAQATQDPLQKIGALTRALDVSVKRDGFQSSLKVVDPSGQGVEAALSQSSIRTQINELMKGVRIVPEVADNGGSVEFSGILKGGLASAGFLAAHSEEADLILVGKITMSDLGRRENWNWVRATVEVSLVEKSTRRVRGSKSWPVKSSAQDAPTARSRALLEVEKIFKEELRSTIIEFASS
jgi:hypothetical protein